MSKKKPTTRKKPPQKKGASSASPKPVTKKPTGPTSKAASKKKSASKKSSAGKKTAVKGAGPAKKKAGAKTSAKKSAVKKTTTKKAAKTTSKKTSKKSETKAAAPPAPAKQEQAAQKDDPKNRKGITVVQQKRSRPSRPKQTTNYGAASAGRLSGLPRKPMIPSGPDAPAQAKKGASEADTGPRKSPFNKRQLAKYRKVLLEKRAILVGELNDLEEGALRGSSGSLSHLPQHMAEQGSEMADQSLSLNLAATERSLIKEIDEALQRIENKTFGVCELTGRPIRPERLEELPWTRYSIDAARELERRSMPR